MLQRLVIALLRAEVVIARMRPESGPHQRAAKAVDDSAAATEVGAEPKE